MKLKIPRVSLSTLLGIIPILYFNCGTAEFVKHHAVVLPIVAVCAVLWLFLMLRERKLTNCNKLNPLLFMGIYTGFLLLLIMFGIQSRIPVLFSDFSNVLFLLFLFCVFLAYSDDSSRNDRLFIVSVWILDTMITCIYSIFRLIGDASLSRDLSTGSFHQTAAAEKTRGIMSYAGVNGLVLILLVWFFVLIVKKNKQSHYVISFITFTVMIFMAQFTIAILFLVFGCLMILYTQNASVGKMFERTILWLGILIIVIQLLPIVVESQLFGYEVSYRINELIMLFSGGEMGGTDIAARFVQYSRSIHAFFKSFGMGKLFFEDVYVGTHSEILDGFANYGFIYVFYILAFYNICHYILRWMKNLPSYRIYKLVLWIYLCMSIINTSTWAPIILSLVVIIPFVCYDEFKIDCSSTSARNMFERNPR